MAKNEGEPADVVILGAGFSAAVNGELPLANPLGNLAYARAWPPGDGASDGVRPYSQDHPFEAALSLLAETQPHLTEAENRRNALSFAELNEAVAGVLDDAQQRAFNVDAPPWLYELLSVLHERRATIVTLNYDTGIETGVETHWLIPDPARVPDLTAPALDYVAGPSEFNKVRATDILRNQPPSPAGALESPSNLVQTMRLLKLHGSVDWWWVPGDPSGASLAREGVYGRFGNAWRLSDQERRDRLPGRERFIVPPLATKSPYYANPLTRQLWQDAYEAIKQARRVALIGYSLPVTDFITFGMLQSAIEDREIRLDVVNRDVDELESRLKALVGVRRTNDLPGWVHRYSGDDCVKNYTRTLADEQSVTFVELLSRHVGTSSGKTSLHVGWPVTGGEVYRKVYRASGPDNTGTLTLYTAAVAGERIVSLQPFDPAPEPDHPDLAYLASRLAESRRIVVVQGDGDPALVVAMRRATHWLRFTPAAFLSNRDE
jgi:hypothetical protein